MKENHTPTPWKWERLGQGTETPDDFFSISGHRKNQVCGNQIALTPMDKEEDEQNAAFIVRAVNNFEELLEALRKCAATHNPSHEICELIEKAGEGL